MTSPVRGILGRLAVSMALLTVVTVAAVGCMALRLARRHLTGELAQNLLDQARLLVPQLPQKALDAGDSAALDRWARRFGRQTGTRVTIVAPGGRVLGDSEVPLEDIGSLENHAARPEIVLAAAQGSGSAIRHSHTKGVDFLYVAVLVKDGTRRMGTLRLALPLSRIDEKMASLRRGVAAASLFCLCGAMLLAALLSRSVHRPVAALSAAAERIGRGELGLQVDIDDSGELGRLAAVMNSLSRRVAGMIAELSAEHARLQATLDNMVEGVAVVGLDGRIVELNAAMERLFGVSFSRARGKPLVETLRHSALESLLEDTLASGSPRQGEVKLFAPEERVFETHANPIFDRGSPRGAVLVVHEITRLRRLEELRKEFVANVSHELRTPLAAIKGFAETLRRGGLDDKEHRLEFIETIERRADGLAKLVDDLLELSRIESGGRPLRLEPVALFSFIEEIAAGLAPLAERRRVAVTVSADPDLRATADKERLRQVLQNLLDNAVKFNKEGGRVEVTARREAGGVSVLVKDTGLGIPPRDLPRIFERFYRVDKARSRELGGTGLGLAIVKHIIEAHGGKVGVESDPGLGSTFRFTLPDPSIVTPSS